MKKLSQRDVLPEYITERAFAMCAFTDAEKETVTITLAKAADKETPAAIAVNTGTLPQHRARAFANALENAAAPEADFKDIRFIVSGSAAPEKRPEPSGRVLPKNVKTVIQVVSGKGGAGKTTVAAALALALAKTGKRVALVDADIYGPSFPALFSIDGKPKVDAGSGLLIPPSYQENDITIPLMSLGFIAEKDGALAWRGPMAGKALSQLFFSVEWPETDMMVVDMPPGTGDAHLTLASKLDVACAVLVTQPSLLSEADAARALSMCRKISVPVAGIVENMAFIEQNGVRMTPFGAGAGARLSEKSDVPCVASLPLLTEHGASPIAAARALSIMLHKTVQSIITRTDA